MENIQILPYSREQKLAIYQLVRKMMAEELRSERFYQGLCYHMQNAIIVLHCHEVENLKDLFHYRGAFDQDQDMESTAFPELMHYKPTRLVYSDGDPDGRYWWNTYQEGIKIRLAILDKIIINI
jgi:hypothetical protein